MVKEIRKFWTQIKSKQTVMGAMIVSLIIAISAFSFASVVPETVEAGDGYETEWDPQAHTDFGYYKTITISSSYINADLVNFPVLVHDSTGNLLGKVLSNGSDIAFYDSTNSTQYNHEIEYYNSTSGELWAWVNLTAVSDSSNTVFYIYYGDSDGGHTVGHNPTYTWDNNYTGVYHMNETTGSTCYDSGRHASHGTYRNSLPSPRETPDSIGYGQYFNFTTSDNVSLPSSAFIPKEGAVMAWYNASWVQDEKQRIFHQRNDTDQDYFQLLTGADEDYEFVVSRSNTPIIDIEAGARQTGMRLYYGSCDVTDDAFLLVNGTLIGTDVDYTLTNTYWGEGSFIGTDNKYRQGAEGIIDEVRLSNAVRNMSWALATYNSTNETIGFMTLGDQVEPASEGASSFSIKGLQDSKITWSGTAADTVWCNLSGDYYETLEINLSVNSTDNVTELRVWFGNLNDTNEWVNASNISVVFSSDNTSWSGGDSSINTTAFTDGGSNVSVNSTQWTDANGMYGTSPFTHGGITDVNLSIYCRFKLAIPSDATTQTFYNSTWWRIYIGHYV